MTIWSYFPSLDLFGYGQRVNDLRSRVEKRESEFDTLAAAIMARMAEWDGQSSADPGHSFYGNELAGEVGELLGAALGLLEFGAAAGRVNNIVKKLDRERLGMAGSRATTEQLGDEMADALICLRRLAIRFDIDLDAHAARKFNATSAAHGLKTRVKETA